MAETLRRSNLGSIRIGSKVNLERALSLKTRLGGHIVSGHIDGTGEIISNVNLECDLIGKYVEKLLGLNFCEKEERNSYISEEFLRNNGFL